MIIVARNAHRLLLDGARDLHDYFMVSMGESVQLRQVDDVQTAPERSIVFCLDGDLPAVAVDPGPTRSYRICVRSDRIILCGVGDRGAAQAGYFLEDLLNLRGAPFLAARDESRSPVFAPRMTHSGWGLHDFPDAYLNQIAHAGMDSILIFASAPDHVPDGMVNRHPERGSRGRPQSFAAIADRCETYGLDVYLYADFHADKAPHPSDPGAERFYDEVYGRCFQLCPKAKGIILVGESIEFPSHDPLTTGRLRLDPTPGQLPTTKPSPGWWPCTDFPQWVEQVRDACRRYNPDAEIVFWTYNWGWAPEPERLQLINSLPADITVQVTFEMFESIKHDGVTSRCVDYTASVVGPGSYFSSEAAAAHERGIKLLAMSNTGGLTWDFGSIPYQPIPQQWSKRHQALTQAQRDWGLAGLMENHHFGWWPSIVSDLAKWAYWSPTPHPDEALRAIAVRDFGTGADQALAGWQAWSDAATDYIPTNADQYGPFRIGPSYPLTLFTRPQLVVAEDAMVGDLIVHIPYEPDPGSASGTGGRPDKTANAIRISAELASLTRMLSRWREGSALMAEAVTLAPAYRQPQGSAMANLGTFIEHCIQTTIHVKQWWQLRSRLLIEDDPDAADELLDRLTTLGGRELDNARQAIGNVERDSRLGWEPSMDYLGDADHIRWKIAHLQHALDHEIPTFRASLRV